MFCNRSISYFLKLLVKQLVVMNITNFFHAVSDMFFNIPFFRAASDIIFQYYINIIVLSF